jgi:hypothetical protein
MTLFHDPSLAAVFHPDPSSIGRPSGQDERVDVRAVLTQVDPKSILLPLIYPRDVRSQRAELDENVRGNARVGVSAGSSRSVAARDADSRSPTVPTLEISR